MEETKPWDVLGVQDQGTELGMNWGGWSWDGHSGTAHQHPQHVYLG